MFDVSNAVVRAFQFIGLYSRQFSVPTFHHPLVPSSLQSINSNLPLQIEWFCNAPRLQRHFSKCTKCVTFLSVHCSFSVFCFYSLSALKDIAIQITHPLLIDIQNISNLHIPTFKEKISKLDTMIIKLFCDYLSMV